MKPPWLKSKIPSGKNYHDLKNLFRELKLNTVCEEAQCPNVSDCWNRQTATVMIMGDTCTRSCGFCAVHTGRPEALDPHEPERVANALSRLHLKHVVITSVDRDDLSDGGASHFAETIRQVRQACPETFLEVLIPDFRADFSALKKIFTAQPHVLNHNLETVSALQKAVRPQAGYERSLQVLRWASEAGIPAKSGLMLGLGESDEQIAEALRDLKTQGQVSILTLGQYLRPTPRHLPVVKYYSPEEFLTWKHFAENLGFASVASGPLVRSSYHADEVAAPILPGLQALTVQAVEVVEPMGKDT